MATKLFLSHAHDEADLALSFANWLERAFSSPVEVICTSRPDHRVEAMVTEGIVKHLRDSKAVLSLLTPESIRGPWMYYEMGAAHALELGFFPCLARGLRFSDSPPQAREYQGVELYSADSVAKLVRALADRLQLGLADTIDAEAIAHRLS
ncbi:TIR domain-containing protein [Nitrosomonas sp.]|uniref:TIR domain-containing protein n=1 Tax=Nitrosomonas sp. TaxID=42353 RepID=UPI00260622DA|nr:TIR domain-containing protein [Nitrosomonas sp.]